MDGNERKKKRPGDGERREPDEARKEGRGPRGEGAGPGGRSRGGRFGPGAHRGPHGGPHGGPMRRRGPEPEAEGDVNARLAHCLRTAGHLMRMRSEAREGQMRILILLSGEAMTQRDLTEKLGIRPGSASEIMAKLENAGLVTRTPNESDRRTTDVRLTEAGREIARKAEEERRSRRGEMFSCLTEEEKETLVSLLEKLKNSWENEE